MTPYWDNGIVQLHHGDARDVLAQMPPESVHCVVTSPPYWGLRDTEGLRLGAAAFRYQTCPKCGVEIDTDGDEGLWHHRSECNVSFRPQLNTYDEAVMRDRARSV